jgi:general secretion pathway protein A
MYLDFHGFREKPFNLTPDPRFIFLSKTHKEAFAHLLYGINNHAGFIALTGEVGSGKTTVLRSLLSQLDAEHHRTALIFNPCLSPPELLQNINREFGIQTNTSNISSLLDGLNLFLLQQNAEGRTSVLIIDEAQNLEAPVLEQIRLISNLETDREKLIQIVLSGQPELMEILKRDEMRQLNQRITVRYHLQPMDFEDTLYYINHRLEVAGRRGGAIFSGRALKRIYRYSRGLPRLINSACDRALLASYTRDTTRISSRIAAEGIKDVRMNMASHTWRRRLILIPAFAMLAVLIAVGIYFALPDYTNRFISSQHIEATEERTKKYPAITGTVEEIKKDSILTDEELSRAIAAELGKVPESESGRRAFNNLAGFWNVPPVPENSNLNTFNEMERAAHDRELRLYRFSGNLGALLRIDYPAVLELTIPGISGKRFVSLVGMENEQLFIDPPIGGRKSLSFRELEKHWSGQGFLLWKDPLNLLNLWANIWPGSKGVRIQRLQDLLREAGVYKSPSTGVYDDDTFSAVKEFQSSRGINQDGIVGSQTLILLYRSNDRFELPRLTVVQK